MQRSVQIWQSLCETLVLLNNLYSLRWNIRCLHFYFFKYNALFSNIMKNCTKHLNSILWVDALFRSQRSQTREMAPIFLWSLNLFIATSFLNLVYFLEKLKSFIVWLSGEKTSQQDQMFVRTSLPTLPIIGDFWQLRHWLLCWQLRTWIHNSLCFLTIKSDTGQHSQFLRCYKL